MFSTYIKSGFIVVVMSALLSAYTGCSTMNAGMEAGPDSPPATLDKRYKEGLRLFDAGDYYGAAQIFSGLSGDDFPLSLRKKSLYAWAVSAMLTASNDEDFKSAMELWRKWESSGRITDAHEDPRLMGPLLLYMRPPYGALPKSDSVDHRIDESDVLKKKNAERDAERQRKQKIAEIEASCSRQYRAYEKEINRLKNQIRALESLDHHMQERKKDMSQ